jgi:nitroreductase
VELSEVLRRRRSVRSFEQRPVDAAVLDRLLDAARRAPSAGFSQGLDFLVLDQPASVARFWELTNDPAFPHEPEDLAVGPTVLVLAFSDPQRYLARYSQPDKIAFGLDRAETWPVRFWDTDTAMACMVLLLAVVDAGLAAWFFGVAYGEADLRRDLGVPDDRNLVGVIGLGHAAPYEAPKGSAYSLSRRPFDEMVHRNHW